MSAEKYIIKAGKKSEYSLEEFKKINEELIEEFKEGDMYIASDIILIFNEIMETSTADADNDIAKRYIIENMAKYFKEKGCDVTELRIGGWDPQIFVIFQDE